MSGANRREFLQKSAAAGAAAFAAPAIVARAAGANERIRVGLLGLGGRMSSHIGSLAKMTDEVDLVAVCDCDDEKLASAEKRYPDLAGKKFKVFKDLRKMYEDRDIDAVSISTQDHWHALQTIWACQAGKHVYVEKPPTWSIWEGRKMVEAARKYKGMVQIGTLNAACTRSRFSPAPTSPPRPPTTSTSSAGAWGSIPIRRLSCRWAGATFRATPPTPTRRIRRRFSANGQAASCW